MAKKTGPGTQITVRCCSRCGTSKTFAGANADEIMKAMDACGWHEVAYADNLDLCRACDKLADAEYTENFWRD